MARPSADASRWGTLGSRVRQVVLLLFFIGLGIFLWFIWAASAKPAWWNPPQASDPVVRELADTVEMRVIEETHKVREPLDIWRVRVTEEQVNAWLSSKLHAWVEHEYGKSWPPELGRVQVHFGEGAAHAGIEIFGDESDSAHIASAQCRLELTEDGALRVLTERVSLGRVALPSTNVEAISTFITERFPNTVDIDALDQAIAILTGNEPIDPVFELGDGRRVRLVEVELHDGEALLGCRTIRAGE